MCASELERGRSIPNAQTCTHQHIIAIDVCAFYFSHEMALFGFAFKINKRYYGPNHLKLDSYPYKNTHTHKHLCTSAVDCKIFYFLESIVFHGSSYYIFRLVLHLFFLFSFSFFFMYIRFYRRSCWILCITHFFRLLNFSCFSFLRIFLVLVLVFFYNTYKICVKKTKNDDDVDGLSHSYIR